MKILVFFTYGVSLKHWHDKGLLSREIALYNRLIKQHGIEVGFITYGDETDVKYKNLVGEIEVIPIYAHTKRPKNRYFQLLKTLAVPWILSTQLKEFDLYKTNQILGGWLAVISNILYKKPLITRCGYEFFDFALKSKKGSGYRIFAYLISFFAYKSASRIHVATKMDKDFVADRFNIRSSTVHVFPNWIDISKYKPDRSLKKSGSILFVGRLNKQKNIPLLLKSLVGTNISLDIVGSGELEAELKGKAKGLGVVVNFLGNVANDKMPEIYNRYSVYVLCSYYEGNPKTLLEAMSCGCAVVGTDVPGIQEVIAHEENGLLVAKTPDSLRSAILRLYKDQSLSISLGNQAARDIEKNNSLENAVATEARSYHYLLADNA